MRRIRFVIAFALFSLFMQITFVALSVPKVAAAKSEINLSVVVRDRLPTETINDFDYSNINPDSQEKIYC